MIKDHTNQVKALLLMIYPVWIFFSLMECKDWKTFKDCAFLRFSLEEETYKKKVK